MDRFKTLVSFKIVFNVGVVYHPNAWLNESIQNNETLFIDYRDLARNIES